MAVVESGPLLERFTARAERLGVRVQRCRPADMPAAILRAIEGEHVGAALVADDFGEGRDALLAALQGAGVQLLKGTTPQEAEPADLGVTRAAYAVAETGSIVVLGDLPSRLPTMLPPIHVAVVDAATVYPSLEDATERIERAMTAEGARYASFITGPSRTADVEKTLAVGVHGPRLLHIVLVDPAE